MRVTIIGGGILGTAHALAAVRRGHEVVQLEREPEARGATVRNFGLVWVSGRAEHELASTLRSRELWEELGGKVPGIGFRANGSITLVRTPEELAVAEAAAAGASADARGFRLLEPEQVRALNPALRGTYLAGLHCATDAAVESRQALPALRAYLTGTGRYTFHPATEARSVAGSSATVLDDHGRVHAGDLVLVCPGATHSGLVRELVGEIPVRRVRLQMMQTAPLGEPLTTSIADGDSFRYYPGFAGPAVEALEREQSQAATAAEHKMQLLCVQRLHGGLTIGDTHEYTEPFAFDVDEAPYEHLTAVTEELLGRTLPPVVRRWAGVYSQSVDPAAIVTRARADEHVWVITGPGGRGMTLGPALGEETAELLGL
ncbi:TIGR03364 family FAD-dependent oxidoreductase [Nocardia farcinica]|uniref:D-amino acid dehydrogenase small subunit n=1 Tax=Nocardia farcinica TaxID=37329 RepID=A0A0H5NFW7_NOCFR|nr:TIGR03364 family FAD-dependent oxidoreductase [Nocardia farcinica]AXK89078.1 TIGR03364 family FAD-dependent oxidoreductase [Nocardia farcinica]MBA4856132.1 TIGR03364 family FAD-dependent oxidoreductase [Nocardia farcinica]MBC9816341.1 TIGR03364 family FAD-dependent oxidoreductase [Nocardia farcinica]MBF6250335.1 TIGR03364 family FAD-dependent oxidoreductase [Nocardia farcinica]MBF6262263.1 TIGR03364 family FAD-dependent oxidoreductase [Nocardia farcinica]